ncbi:MULTISPECIES: DNA methyltransferase [unclassified Nonomuraea]|uniref:DNA methyltransferase n=1 Tax=unclassified Nonomuraea TaxID=2593643 RepID=UPI00339AC0F1
MSENEKPQSKRSRTAERRLVPLSVWLCPDATPGESGIKEHPRVTETVCGRHRQAVGRELSRHLIGACSRPGGVVADVFPTSETVLVTAAGMERLGVGCVPRLPDAQQLAGRLRQELAADQRAAVRLRPYGPHQLREALLGLQGRVELLIAALPPYPETGRPAGPASASCPSCKAEQPTLAMPQLGRFLEDARHVLAPGGHLAVITTARHERGRLVDLLAGDHPASRRGRAGLRAACHRGARPGGG